MIAFLVILWLSQENLNFFHDYNNYSDEFVCQRQRLVTGHTDLLPLSLEGH